MNVYLATLGCRLNEAEIADWDRELGKRGHLAVANAEDAHVVVVNSCAVTAEAARKSRKLTSSLRRRVPQAKMILTGCYASLDLDRARKMAGVDDVIDNQDKPFLVERLEALVVDFDFPNEPTNPPPMLAARVARTRAFIKVQDGCRNRCTFCIVTIARGTERSRTVADIVDQIAIAAASGVREAVLTGVHLGGFGSDNGSNLSELVRAILADTDIPRLRLSSLEPWDLPADFHTLWQSPRLAPHLHLPLQSGCDATLKRMARRCPTERYRRLVDKLRGNINDLVLTTDLIVGFPGETDKEWSQTKSFVESIGFADMHIFTYSTREGTTAARFDGQIDVATKKARSAEMHAIASHMKHAALSRFIGHTRPVLWEANPTLANQSTKGNGENQTRRYLGYTDNYLRVEANVEIGLDLEGLVCPALLISIQNGRLQAELDKATLSQNDPHLISSSINRRPRIHLPVSPR